MARAYAWILSFLLLINPVQLSGGYEKMTGMKESLYVLFNKKEVVSEYHNGAESDEVFDENKEFSFDEAVTVKKEKGRDFKILTLDDIHYSDYGYRALLSVFNSMRIKNLVKKTSPDLIILPGDFVCGDSAYYSIQRITDMMESFGIPWAPVFGNHDDETNCDLNYIADIMMQSEHCLLRKGDSRMGVGNYIINVVEENENGSCETVECIFMMDSHHSQPFEIQQKWFKWAADGINNLTDNKAEISVFMHIPLPEYQYAYDEAWNDESGQWNSGFEAYGELHETICCERDADGNPVQRGFFDVIKETGTAKYVFCAHDHMNNFSVMYNGVRLTYLMKLGKASGYQPLFDGGSVITVENSGIKEITHKTLLPIIGKAKVDIKM